MDFRWFEGAAQDLEDIFDFNWSSSPAAAQRAVQTIYERSNDLARFPRMGRVGRLKGTRELPLPPLPFMVIYRILEHADAIEILNVIHGTQRWPPVS